VDDAPSGNHLPDVVAAAVETPAMPELAGVMLQRFPHVIPGGYGQRHGLGWQGSKRDGPCFIVARCGTFGVKVVDHFPLTEDGWSQAWAALVKLDAGVAQETAETLQQMSAAAVVRAAEVASRAQVYEAFVNAGGPTVSSYLACRS
jgi:hypothetical protein